MSFRKEQEAARARAAEPIDLGMGRHPYVSTSDAFGADIVHRMFAEHRARQAKEAPADESVVYRYYEAADKAADYTFSWWEDGQAHPRDYYSTRQWNGPGHGWTAAPPYNWKEDPDCTDPFRVLPDGTIDLHPSQWSVIA